MLRAGRIESTRSGSSSGSGRTLDWGKDACEQCAGTSGADSDGDGYCAATETAVGCNPNDGAEIPAQPTTYGGGHAAGDVLITYLAPTDRKITRATDPSCASAGVCAPNHFCSAGRIADPCTTNADCNLPANTCRVVANYGAVPDLAVRRPFKLNQRVITAFEPLTPGCSRKVNLLMDQSHGSSKLKIQVSGTLGAAAPRYRHVHVSLRPVGEPRGAAGAARPSTRPGL